MVNHEASPKANSRQKFFYGYIVVMAAFFVLMVSMGVYTSFGVFFKPLVNEFHWTSAMTSGAVSLSMFMYGLLSIVMGGLSDRFGPRIVLTVCGFLLGSGYLLMSRADALWQLYLFIGVIVGTGIGGIWVPQLSAGARWFVTRRSLMTGIAVAGVGIGQFIGPLLISRMISAYDWRRSYMILGIVVLIAVVIAAQFLKRDPAQMGLRPYGEAKQKPHELEVESRAISLREAVRTIQFWLTVIIFFSFGYCAMSLFVHIVPQAIDLGIPAVSAANILAINGAASIIGNYVLGGMGDKIGNKQIYVIANILLVSAFSGLVFAGDMGMFLLYSAVIGLAFGGMAAIESPIVAWLFGLRSHGLIYGIIHLGYTFGAAAGPFFTGYIFDLIGGYQIAFMVCVALAVIGLISAVLLKPIKVAAGNRQSLVF
jgi:MFS family permease